MRLSAEIAKALVDVIEKEVPDSKSSSTLYLFGSRTDDLKRGGDIDLLLVTNENVKSRLKEKKYFLLESLRQAAGDQKVDLTLKTYEEFCVDPFVQTLKLVELAKI
jgi:uncharacterized protein